MHRRRFLRLASLMAVAAAASPASAIERYDSTTFKKLSSSGLTIVHVHADWCPVCRVQEPALEGIAKDPRFRGAQFVRVDFDRDRDFLKTYRVANQSVILVLKNGVELGRIAGVSDAAALKAELSKFK